jgi:hypothetical protein
VGADFSAIIGHTMTNKDLINFCADLNAKGILEMDKYLLILSSNKALLEQFRWEADLNDLNLIIKNDRFKGELEICGPLGLSLKIFSNTCVIEHYTRWLTFILNDLDIDYRRVLRGICFELVSYFGGNYAIYVPDSQYKSSVALEKVYDGADINEINLLLKRSCGMPADIIEEIFIENDIRISDTGYFIDTFKDFKKI